MGRTVASCIIVIMAFTMLGCSEEERTSLNVVERKEVNEKYKAILDSLNKSLINECKENRKKNFNSIVDSLKNTRLKEILLITKVKGNEK
ncbi:MAG: hypothetical protein P8H42_01105 [Saprospiraceae bacterium]|jgi:hypothetical protein|nr:hypothetical protein [Saprospiraceae bacterium]